MNNTKKISELSILAAILVILMTGSNYIPFLGSVLLLITPVPLVYVIIRHHWSHALAVGVVSAVIASAIITPIVALFFLAFAFGVALPIALGLKHKFEPVLTVFLAALVIVGLTLVLDYFYLKSSGVTIKDTLIQTYQSATELNISGLESIKTTNPELAGSLDVDANIKNLKAINEMFGDLINLLFPSILLVASMFYSMLVYVITGKILRRLSLGLDIAYPKPFSEFAYPKHFAYGSVLMIVISYALASFGVVDSTLVLSNFSYILTNLFAIQGLAMIYGLMLKKHKKASAVLLTILLTIGIIILSGGMMFLSMIGFIDVFFSFRVRKKRER